MTAREIEIALQRELEKWPGVTMIIGRAGSHKFAEFVWNGQRRRTFYPSTPSDNRVIKNKIGDMRRTLRKMGLLRLKP
jgi:hypothetical protein